MFRHLEYSVTFPSTGRTLSETIDFEKGFGAITGPNGSGKCLAPHTLISDAHTGQTLPVNEWFERFQRGQEIFVWGRDDDYKLRPAKVLDVFKTGRKPMVRVHLQNGNYEDVSLTHPVSTTRGMVNAGDLHLGDYIEVPEHLRSQMKGNLSPFTDDEVVVVSAMMADGSISGGNYTFTKPDLDLVHVLDQALQRRFNLKLVDVGGSSRKARVQWRLSNVVGDRKVLNAEVLRICDALKIDVGRSKGNASLVRSGARGFSYDTITAIAEDYAVDDLHDLAGKLFPLEAIRRYFDAFGLHGTKSVDKHLPLDFFLMSDAQVNLFIRMYWSCDGYVSGPNKSGREISVTTASHRLARDLSRLLLRAGVQSVIRHKVVDGRFPSWGIHPCGRKSVERLLTILSTMPHKGKRDRVVYHLDRLAETTPNDNLMNLPADLVGPLIVDASTRSGLAIYSKEDGLTYCKSQVLQHGRGKQHVAKYAERFGCAKLRDLAESEVEWVRFSHLEPLEEMDTFDIEVDNSTHLYALAGFITHNSSAVEFTRWLLFGSAALRGKADDYKTLKGSLTFTVRGRTLTIERNARGAKLIENDELLVSGTSPVNQKVTQILGFGLTVFDVACVANQGDIEKLGSMKPTERKQMVDSVLGLGVLDDITRWAGDEALVLKREAQAVADTLVPPTEPVEPKGYLPARDLEETITQKQRLHNELMQHRAVPAAGPCPTTLSLEELNEKAKILPLVMELKNLPPASTWTEAELVEEERRIEAASWRGLPEPRYSREQLNQWLVDHDTLEQIRVKGEIQKQIDRLMAGSTTCPACQHCWTEDDAALDHLKAELAQFDDDLVAPATPPLRMVNCLQMLDDWTEFDAQPPKPDLPAPQLNHNQIAAERHKLSFTSRRAELEALTKDYDGTDYTRLKHQLETWMEREAAYAAAQEEVERLEPLVEDLPDLRNLLTEIKLYEAMVDQYVVQRGAYEDGLARVADLTTRSENWSKVKVALSTLRTRVKQHLVPSLNKVASYLITQMTGGVKQQIVVDENFEVLVDNQSLNTLSGSEKAVANLALRIGLGQVLTSNVMSLFIGDEIDASMDNERAENTARCLRNLAQNLSQVLLVTHKYPEADFYVTIGKTYGLLEGNSG